MTETPDDAEGRSGCAPGRLLGGLVRMVLFYPFVSMGSQLGQAAQRALWPQMGTPYEGALIGIAAGLTIGLSLWGSALRGDRWRSRLADGTLAAVTIVWLAAAAAAMSGRLGDGALIVPWTACLGGSGLIAVLLRA